MMPAVGLASGWPDSRYSFPMDAVGIDMPSL
jgi:hypothetical protein